MSEEFGIFKRLLESAVKNIAQSYYDDFSKKNASFRSASGLGTKVIRKDDGKCCEWCSDLSGTYDYDDRPDEIFHRHRNCTCTVVVKYTKDGKTRYTDVYDKKDYVSEKEARIAQAKKMEELDKLSAHDKMLRRAELDAEYSRNYRKGMTQTQKEADLKRKRDAYHEKNPDAKYLSRYKDVVNSYNKPATLNGLTGKELEEATKEFRCYGDYLRDMLGSAIDNNTEELNEIINDIKEKEGTFTFTDHENRMVTNVKKGEPAEVILYEKASIGAVRHEYRHFLDDLNNGCPGLAYYMSDKERFFNFEKRGYDEELAIARKYNYTEAEKKILGEIEKRRKEIYGE